MKKEASKRSANLNKRKSKEEEKEPRNKEDYRE